MLDRAQVRALIDRGRVLVDAVELQVTRSQDLERQHAEAFSAADRPRLERIRKEREASEDEALATRQDLLRVIAELATHARACLSEYRRDAMATGLSSDIEQLPERTEPDRIQECRRYFEEMGRIVNLVALRSAEIRRAQLTGILSELQTLLDKLKNQGHSLPTIEQNLSDETYLDLPLEDAERRLREEVVLVREELARCEERAREQARRERLERGRLAVRRLTDVDAQGLLSEALREAWAVLECGSSDDLLAFWSAVIPNVASGALPLEGQLSDQLCVALEQYGEGGSDPFAAADPLEVSRLDGRLCERAEQLRKLHDFATGAEHPTRAVTDVIERWGRRLPCTSFEVVRGLVDGGRLDIRQVATWARAVQESGRLQRNWLEWVASCAEGSERWVESAVLLECAEKHLRALLSSLVAVAEHPTAPHFREDTWVELVSQDAELHASDVAASVAAVATLIVGERDQFAAHDVLDSLMACLRKRPQLRKVIGLRRDAAGRALSAVLEEAESGRARRETRRKELERLIQGNANPAGRAAVTFYREVMIPHIKERYTKGLDEICNLDPEVVAELMHEHRREFNRTGQDQIRRWIRDMRDLARALRDTESNVLPAGVPSVAAVQAGLRDEAEAVRQNPLLRWAYARASRFLSDAKQPGTDPPALEIPEAGIKCLLASMLRGNPLVDEEESDAIGWATLRDAALLELEDDGSPGWRVTTAAKLDKFASAKSYCAALAPSTREALERMLEERFSLISGELDGLMDLATGVVDNLEPTDDVELIRMYLGEAREALRLRNVRHCRKTIEKLLSECDRVEGEQLETQRREIDSLSATLRRAIGELCSLSVKAPKGALPLLWSATRRIAEGDIRGARRLADAFDDYLAGRPPEEALKDEAGVPFTLQESPPAALAVESLPSIKLPERSPIELRELPRLIQLELESLLKGPSVASSTAEKAFCSARSARREWEEPLVLLLRERGERALANAEFSRAAEYCLAGAQVAYRASARLPKGIEPARLAAINLGRARLLWLLARSGAEARPTNVIARATEQSWTILARDFLLHRGAHDLVDVLKVLIEVAEGLAPEFLDVPLLQVPPLRESILEVLEDQVSTLGVPLRKLLVRVLLNRDHDTDEHVVTRLIDELAELGAGAGGRPGAAERRRVRFQQDLESAALGDDVRRTIRGIVERRVQSEADGVGEPATPEVALSTVTRTLYLDAADQGLVPLHFRLNLMSGRAVRDVVVGLSASHGQLGISRNRRSLEASLRPGEPAELTTYVEKSESAAHDGSDLVLEITDLALREQGVLRSGAITSRTKKITIRVVPVFPNPMRPNPYIVGPAVKEYSLIKGRYEETQKILRVLRGEHQDNVPLVYGNRRIGKTTLLYRLSKDPETRRHYEPILVDFEGVVRRSGPAENLINRFASQVHRFVQGTQLGRVSPPVFAGKSDTLDELQAYLDRLASACGNRGLLLMLDEIELFLDQLRSSANSDGAGIAGDFIQVLRHNMQHNSQISFILAGTPKLLELASQVGERLFHLPVPIEVGELSEHDATALITEPVGEAFEYSTPAKAELLNLTARQPYLLQAVCHELFSFMLDRRLSVVSTAEITSVLEERVFNQSTYFDFQTAPIRKTEEQWKVARIVADLTQEEHRTSMDDICARAQIYDYTDMENDSIERILRKLTEDGILTQDRKKQYRFRFPIVAQYVVRTSQKL